MRGKILISADLKVLTGLHIGGSDAFSAIGAIDSPVVKDSRTNMPIIPGSSLKGKLRTLLAKNLAKDGVAPKSPNSDPPQLLALFGASSPQIIQSRLQFADAFVKNLDEFESVGALTEAKFENTINRVDSSAMPRQIERVVSGTVFGVRITYNIEGPSQTEDDLRLLSKGMKLLQLDYLGGHGTRGSGRVSFESFELTAVEANADTSSLTDLFREVEEYELLTI